MDEQGTEHQSKGDGSIFVTQRAIEFIQRGIEENKPTFTVIWYSSPHSPFEAEQVDLDTVGGNPRWGEIHGIDRAVGLLRKQLRSWGIEETCPWCIISDNGMKGGGLRGDKHQVWEGGIRVPGIIEWPGRITPGRITTIPISTLDSAPTAAALAGVTNLQMAGPIDGTDLTPLFDGLSLERPYPVTFSHFGVDGMVTERYKIVGKPQYA